jgi:hypothetical protein
MKKLPGYEAPAQSYSNHSLNLNPGRSIASNFKGMDTKGAEMLSKKQLPKKIYVFNKDDIVKRLSSMGSRIYNNSHRFVDGTTSVRKL